jgi:hypothetical protein
MTTAFPAMSNFEQHLIAANKTASQEGRLWTLTPRRSRRIVHGVDADRDTGMPGCQKWAYHRQIDLARPLIF